MWYTKAKIRTDLKKFSSLCELLILHPENQNLVKL